MKPLYLLTLLILLAGCGVQDPAGVPTLAPPLSGDNAGGTPVPATAAPPAATAEPTAEPTSAGAAEILITLDASGGIAGMIEHFEVWTDGKLVQTNDRAGSLAEGQATPDQLSQLTALLASPDFKALKSEYMPASTCCDLMTYVLTLPGEGKGSTITTMDGADYPEPLRKVIVLLTQLRLQTTQR